MSELIDLIDGQFQHSNLFVHLPLFDKIHYMGHLEGKVRKYRVEREDQGCTVLALNVIRKDEDILWNAVEDFVKRAVVNAAASVHGVYMFDLLTIDIHKEAKTFNFQELSAMIVNAARRLVPGEQRLIRYCSAYGILQKMIHEDWGKIALKTSVEVFKDKNAYVDILVKHLIKNFEFAHDPGLLLVNDLSCNPIFDGDNEMQQKRLNAVMDKQIPKAIEFPPEVYIQDNRGVRELLSGAVIE